MVLCDTSVLQLDVFQILRIHFGLGLGCVAVMVEPPANIVGGSSVPFGRPVVPEV